MKAFRKIKYSDLKVVATLIAGKNAVVHITGHQNHINYDVTPEICNSGKSVLFNFNPKEDTKANSFDYVVDFSLSLSTKNQNCTSFKTVITPDGTLRYLVNDSQSNFLDFYHNTNLKSTAIKTTLKLLFNLKLSALLFPSFNVISNHELAFLANVEKDSFDSYSIFTGTPGLWRKPVIQFCKNQEAVSYGKYPINPQTQKLIATEKENLTSLSDLNLQQMVTPKVLTTPTMLLLKNIQTKKQKSVSYLSTAHKDAALELISKTISSEKIGNTSFFKNLEKRILSTEKTTSFHKIGSNLKTIFNSIDKETTIDWQMAHGDFTSWNTTIENNQLFCYDWEMKINQAPIGYDLFHYLHQSQTFFNAESNIYEETKETLKKLNTSNLKLAYTLYLLDVITKNLVLTNQQESITKDQITMISNWYKSLMKNTNLNTQTKMRVAFLKELQTLLNTTKYAVLKNTNRNLESLPENSDLDLAILKEDIAKVTEFAIEHPNVASVITVKKTFMHTLEIYFNDKSYLSVDMIFDFIRKGQRYLDIDEVINSRIYDKNGFYIPHVIDDIEYIHQFYTLNNSKIPKRYIELYTNKLILSGLEDFYLQYFINKYDLKYKCIEDSFEYSEKKKNALKKHNVENQEKNMFKKMLLKVKYLKDVYTDLTLNKGFILTFSGVDGAGKTTIINEVRSCLENKYRKRVVQLRHRPGVLPILSAMKHGGSAEKAERAAGERLPRQGTNKNVLSSVVRFSYYYLDYLLGQSYVYFKYVLRGKIVIYDRYYYDFINDSKRSNINLNRNIIKSLFHFIHKPEFNFYLYNTPEVILQRKKELSADDINSLNSKYQSLFTQLQKNCNGDYTQIKNDDKEQTVLEIFDKIYQTPA